MKTSFARVCSINCLISGSESRPVPICSTPNHRFSSTGATSASKMQVLGKVLLYMLGMIYQQNNPYPPQKHLSWYGARIAESAFRTPAVGKSEVHTCSLAHGKMKQHPRFRNLLLLSDKMPFPDNGKRGEPTI